MCSSSCFGRLHAHHQELTTALTASGFTLECGGSSVVGHGLAGRPAGQTTTNNAATTTLQGKTKGCQCSCKLLMMGVEAPETCWATHKHQVINLWNCCIWLVNLFGPYREFYKNWSWNMESKSCSCLYNFLWITCTPNFMKIRLLPRRCYGVTYRRT